MSKHNKKSNHTLTSILLILVLSLAFCILVYKSQVQYENDKQIEYTLVAAHKDNGKVTLTRDNPELYEDFVCRVPGLKKLQFRAAPKKVITGSRLLLEVSSPDSGEVFYKKEASLSYFFSSRQKKREIKLKNLPKETEGLNLRLHMKLLIPDSQGEDALSQDSAQAAGSTDSNGSTSSAGSTSSTASAAPTSSESPTDDMKLVLTSVYKPGTVISFNGNPEDYTNVIYRMKYGHLSEMTKLYWFLCLCMLVTLLAAYYLIVIRKWNYRKWFPLIAFMMGLVIQWVIPVYGAPDEPWHMDTAYQLSNKIMHVDKTPQEGTVLKRECDIITADLLANDVESNSYYQLWHSTLDKAQDTDLNRVTYVDTSHQAPRLVYIPSALGIITGRLLHLSGMMTYQLARVFSLLAYVLLAWLAVAIIPFCNNLMAAIAISMIALQQAASASYDAMINGILFLFIALCLSLSYGKDKKRRIIYTILIILMAVFIAISKGGVYTPVILLPLLLLSGRKHGGQADRQDRLDRRTRQHGKSTLDKEKRKKSGYKLVLATTGGAVAIAGLIAWKFYPILVSLSAGTGTKGESYTPAYVIGHPLQLIYTYWRTVIEFGETLLRGMMGGRLGWHNIIISWLFITPLILCLLLLVHVENERPPQELKYRITAIAISLLVILLTLTGMLLAETKIGDPAVLGTQGRYFIPVEILLFSAFSTQMINVSREKAGQIFFSVILIELLALMQVLVCFI